MAIESRETKTPTALASFVWSLLCLIMWFWAVAGPLFVAVEIASYFADLKGFLEIPARDAISLGSTFSAVGISFVWLRRQRYLRFGEK